MFEVFELIDKRILALFTKFSHWFQRLTGQTNFFLARVFLFLVVTEMIVRLLNYWLHFLSRKTTIIDVVVSPVLVLFSVIYLHCLHQADEQIYRDNTVKPFIQHLFESGSAGSAITMVFMRVLGMILIVLALPMDVEDLLFRKLEKNVVWALEAYTSFGLAYFIVFIYFVLVDPLPPGKSKVRQWVESVSAGFRKTAPARQPN